VNSAHHSHRGAGSGSGSGSGAATLAAPSQKVDFPLDLHCELDKSTVEHAYSATNSLFSPIHEPFIVNVQCQCSITSKIEQLMKLR
jgi:hypothetical protein